VRKWVPNNRKSELYMTVFLQGICSERYVYLASLFEIRLFTFSYNTNLFFSLKDNDEAFNLAVVFLLTLSLFSPFFPV
jgi:hypothetical protein